ncbi:endonuclease/exonuclease/phosphatase family protein [Paracnuella aquatica]|uniref:endonuclease/exonuclease/phosphatase family protein n=1 Tax=Paracnuella aquatica TaxID=2268757 RepID=UPI000DEEDF7C|nr:endonuclease/exonuclease/phosphatase family protein [Paracnuella aquatica]RPD48265.1 endonuclease/exonuclease/phosphatase family protein [Paracnuella aquatica]
MRTTLLSLVCFLLAIGAVAQEPLHVMSFNIRLNTTSDSLNAWPYRKDKVAQQVLFYQTHLLGVQEALHLQMQELQQRLPQFKYIGVGRDDGKEKGEYSAIFYDTTRLQALQSGTFWLSETPEVPGSKSWDAAITRVASWARFRDRKAGKEFFAINTHFDHMGKVARAESARLLLQRMHQMGGNLPVVLTGDFNAKPSEEPIKILTDSTALIYVQDAKALSQMPHFGPTGTFNGWGPKENDNEPIDFIFIRNGFRVLRHATLSQSWQGRFSSDHFPVFAALVF